MVCKDLRCLSGDRVHQGLFGTTSYYQGNWTRTKTQRVLMVVTLTLTLTLEQHHPSREVAPTAATAPEKSRRRSSLPLPSSLLAASAAPSEKQGKRVVAQSPVQSIDQGRFFLVAGDALQLVMFLPSFIEECRVWVWVHIRKNRIVNCSSPFLFWVSVYEF